ncbi:hypothetical protein B0H19DRAFT_1080674 [Mycena capillaripes]|nr:hypothetical protein B0H19DRAFT_1080674 [Mycena capillaripes]
MEGRSLFDIQELVEHCVSFLSDSASDLKASVACALVALSWVNSAQSNVHRTLHMSNPYLTSSDRLLQFQGTLEASSHLIRHVRHLTVRTHHNQIAGTTLEKICHFPYTHVGNASLSLTLFFPPYVLEQFLSLPTPRRVKLCRPLPLFYSDLGAMLPNDPRRRTSNSLLPPIPNRVTPIQLQSLRLVFWGSHSYEREQKHIPGPSIPWISPISRRFPSTIQVLDVEATVCASSDAMVWFADNPEQESGFAVDLASFLNLSLLRVALDDSLPPTVLAKLSTIAPWHRMRTIIVSLGDYNLDPTDCAQLDSTLSTLSVEYLPTVEFEDSSRLISGGRTWSTRCNSSYRLLRMVDLKSSFMTHGVTVTEHASNKIEVESSRAMVQDVASRKIFGPWVLQADWRSYRSQLKAALLTGFWLL